MTTLRILLACAILALLPNTVLAACENNVDRVEVHYINGMFTDGAAFMQNLSVIRSFLITAFAGWDIDYDVSASYNDNEKALAQLAEVARHKFQDAHANVRLAIKRFLNGDPEYLNDPEAVQAVQEFLDSINAAYQGILAEQDTVMAKSNLVKLLNTCSRVVLMTHSQGNFYGNALFNDLYASYVFPNGYPLAQYPMLGTMQIASPVYRPGGAAGLIYPEAVGHVTNDNDLVMAFVRLITGGVEANYDALYNPADFSGHGLEDSYLTQPGQASEIALQMANIIRSLIPFPLHGQVAASSSALLGFGHSKINNFLDIQFTGGAVYRYENVFADVFEGLRTAPSQGGYFNEYVRNAYVFTRLE